MSGILRPRALAVMITALVATTITPGIAQARPDQPAPTNIVRVLGKGGDGGQYLTAPDGRQIILRGLNTKGTTKIDPECMPRYGAAEIAREQTELGSNAVRLLLQWRCVEPEPNVYDERYLDRLEALVKLYNDHGLTVLFDMHQDMWGPGITPDGKTGNGAPKWATYMDGLPVKKQTSWAMYYLEPGVVRAFDNFWNKFGNHPELVGHYARMWAHVAQRFAHNPGVFGYDLMNEPFMGSVMPSTLEQGALATLYRMTIAEIRKVDNDSWIFVEPVALGANQGFGTSLPRFADPRQGKPKIGYAPHMYILGTEDGGMPGALAPAVKAGINLWQANVRKQARDLSPDGTTVPILVGEYGLNPVRNGALDYIAYAQSRFGEMGAGVFYYSSDAEWGPWNDDGSTTQSFGALSVCYASAVSGFLASQSTSPDGCTLRFERSDAGLTLVRVPWASGVHDVAVTGAQVVGFDLDQQTLSLQVPHKDGLIVQVTKVG